MNSLLNRFKAAWSAFMHSHQPPLYAVIYDEWQGGDPGCGDVTETYWEVFQSPEEAHMFFRTGFPPDVIAGADNPRLVMILGPIDRYGGQEEVTSPGSDAITYFPLHC